jgi:hypothetical protein
MEGMAASDVLISLYPMREGVSSNQAYQLLWDDVHLAQLPGIACEVQWLCSLLELVWQS